MGIDDGPCKIKEHSKYSRKDGHLIMIIATSCLHL